MYKRFIEIMVGLFIIAGAIALIILALKVSGLTRLHTNDYYTLTAEFDNIGGLRVRAPVRLAGVTIGQVTGINLNQTTFRAKVTFIINESNELPVDTSASILTEGLLGSNYIGLTPGYETQVLQNGGQIDTTHPALILENLVGQLLFNLRLQGKKN